MKQYNKGNARDQASDVVLRKLFCVKYLRRHVIDNHCRDLQASNYAKVSINPGRATRSKIKLLKFLKKPLVKGRNGATFLLTNLGTKTAAAQSQTVTKWAAKI